MEVKDIDYLFKLRNHWWFDAGIAAFYDIAGRLKKSDRQKWSEVKVIVRPDGIVVSAPDRLLKPFVDACYEYLGAQWWNVSSSKQEEAKDLVVYNKSKKTFLCVPRRNPTPVAALSVGGSSWKADYDIYDDLPDEMKKKTDEFLKESGKSLWGIKKDKLPYEQPVCHPHIETFPVKGKKRVCSVCGQELVCEGVNQTVFPLFSSQSAAFSFNSKFGTPDIVCWECAMLGKFAVHSALYKVADPYTQIMQIYSNNMEALINAHDVMGNSSDIRIFERDKLYFRDFGTSESLVELARLPYEVLWSFFLVSFDELDKRKKNAIDAEDKLKRVGSLSEEDLDCLAATGVVTMSLEKKGQTFITKELVDFHDSVYIFRLIDYVEREIREDKIINKDKGDFWKNLFWDLLLVQNKQKKFDPVNGLYRNRMLQKVFEKSSILRDAENFVFKKSLIENYPYLYRILFFVTLYERVINKRDGEHEGGKGMTKEQVAIATSLGAQIIIGGKKALMEDSKDVNKLKPLKGDLFSLRKTRSATDFLEQLGRLQFRYGLVLNQEIIKGILVEKDVKFEDFKAYCMISALNGYNREFGFAEKSNSASGAAENK
ncbi:hypothetical protein [Cloacibacillus evryensis]|uniref:hypothetical protein n=1 Tax=Cloacibacillus evryensis TaxID=508460 RepID=UPI000451C50C|nr:hypothetical protein [Cloacibacillus evryensis]EXG78626.1 hypothetical protein Cloev_0754 [Cloacibacillus evryensis DSM 19522]MCQ4764522.1 hypothetical protein [Cloacibacillus evryensis]